MTADHQPRLHDFDLHSGDRVTIRPQSKPRKRVSPFVLEVHEVSPTGDVIGQIERPNERNVRGSVAPTTVVIEVKFTSRT